MSVIDAVRLHFKDSRSDKVYNVDLIEVAVGAYDVVASWGKRGGTLTTAKKAESVPMRKARTVFDKLVDEKTKKGYNVISSGGGGTPAMRPAAAAVKVSGMGCMLLNPLSESELEELIEDDDWVMQEKMDGERVRVRIGSERDVVAANRESVARGLPSEVHAALSELPALTELDGELVGGVYHVFDVLSVEGRELSEMPLSRRLAALKGVRLATDGPLKKVPVAETDVEKAALLERVRSENGEGVVLKKARSAYSVGRPASGGDWRKFKFVESATCVVLLRNPDKRSVSLGLYETVGGKIVNVGNVTIPVNHSVPEPGAVVEVRYLYAYPGGSLFQPVYLGERSDVTAANALLKQLKYKAGTVAEEAA